MMENRDDWDQHWANYDLTARYNPAQAYRREITLHWIKSQPAAAARILDIGSGQGDLAVILAQAFAGSEIAGIEASAIGIAQSRIKAPSVSFFQRDLLIEPAPDDGLREWATMAICSEVLEHVDQPEIVLANAARYLRPGAPLLITVPGGPMSVFDRHIGHRRHFDTQSLKKLIGDAGLVPERVSGVGLPFFNLYRMIIILRGKALIRDASAESRQDVGLLARIAMGTFSRVLKRRMNSSSLGWQMIGEARKPD
ncbi:MAG TPA: class I SAM-dependent methyltransferase [Candidatus Methylacidiphilales bacterium]|nr:class I SAM-dependent methyltransferase [Candidatus Methylacidiphilales bacterium]